MNLSLWIVTCNNKWNLYDNWQWPAQWLNQEGTPKHFPKSNLHQKKVMVTVWWSAAHLIHYSFLNPSDIITSEKYAQQINEMHQNLQQALINRKDPILLQNNTLPHVAQLMLQKLNKLGCEVFSHLPVFTWPLANRLDYHFKHLDSFLQGKHLHNQQDAENAFQESVKSWNMDFYATGVNKLISRWQKKMWWL